MILLVFLPYIKRKTPIGDGNPFLTSFNIFLFSYIKRKTPIGDGNWSKPSENSYFTYIKRKTPTGDGNLLKAFQSLYML